MYFDKNGKPIGMFEWATLFEDKKYKIIKQEVLPNDYFVSTIWLGLNHRFNEGNPLIFESLVFPAKGNWSKLDCERYSTLAEAKKGHKKLVKKWS
jgi:hypothetical protein